MQALGRPFQHLLKDGIVAVYSFCHMPINVRTSDDTWGLDSIDPFAQR